MIGVGLHSYCIGGIDFVLAIDNVCALHLTCVARVF